MTGIEIATSVVGFLTKLGVFKGKTPHLSDVDAQKIGTQVSKEFYSALVKVYGTTGVESLLEPLRVYVQGLRGSWWGADGWNASYWRAMDTHTTVLGLLDTLCTWIARNVDASNEGEATRMYQAVFAGIGDLYVTNGVPLSTLGKLVDGVKAGGSAVVSGDWELALKFLPWLALVGVVGFFLVKKVRS